MRIVAGTTAPILATSTPTHKFDICNTASFDYVSYGEAASHGEAATYVKAASYGEVAS